MARVSKLRERVRELYSMEFGRGRLLKEQARGMTVEEMIRALKL